MEKKLTIFTPTYNRGYILDRCYKSLKNQTNKNFIWLIIDDGSTDDTKEIVNTWIKENEIEIRYVYQENQGMHGAHNTAYELIGTELNVCIDSDDYMPDDAVYKILKFWEENKAEDIAGFIGLDQYNNGCIIGSKFPNYLKKSTLYDIYYKYGVKGDKKIVYRSDISKRYPYPIFKGEKLVPLSYKYRKIDLEYKLAIMNEVLCIVEYMEDGSSRNIFKQYLNSPKGFAFSRIENMKNPNASIYFKFKESIHYVSSSFICRNRKFVHESPYKIMTILSIPLGYIMYRYIINKYSKQKY